MNTVYFDWSHKEVTTVTNDSDEIVGYPTLDALLDSLTEPTVIVGEASFESYDREARDRFISRARDEGHTLLVTPNRQTGRHRSLLGLDKTDAHDVRVIRDIAVNTPTHLKTPQILDPAWEQFAAQARFGMMLLRNTGAQDDIYAFLVKFLPDPKTLDEPMRSSLVGADRKYSKPVLVAVYEATRQTRNRREFERLLGLYHHGYPSIFRSQVYHHGMRHAVGLGNPGKELKGRGVTKSEFRRSIRWLRREIIRQGLVWS